MAGEDLQRIEAMFGAISKIASGEEVNDLFDARCPKCNASSFIQLSDLFSEAVGRIEQHPDQANAVHVGGVSDITIVGKFKPPRRKSAGPLVAAVAIPLGAAAYYVYTRFGDSPGQLAIVVASIATVIVLLTTIRRLGDQYYHARQKWNKLYMCRQCGQLVAS
ncbi:MAG: hypothetical protein ACREPM_10020 [Gemmatimonadaceae bacterium]